jgi:DNA-binding protein HU-beta
LFTWDTHLPGQVKPFFFIFAPSGETASFKAYDEYIVHLNEIAGSCYIIHKNNMTKADIIALIAQKTGIEKADVSQTIEAFFKTVKDSLSEGEALYVRGFGSFTVKTRRAKTGRNISKNTAVLIPEQIVPTFKPAKEFVARVKANAAHFVE